MKSIKFKSTVAAKGRSFIAVNGMDFYKRESMHGIPSPETPNVICITPLFNNVPRSVEVEIPFESVGNFVEMLGTQLDPPKNISPNEYTRYTAWCEGLHQPGKFERHVLEAFARADSENVARLRAAFPDFFITTKIW